MDNMGCMFLCIGDLRQTVLALSAQVRELKQCCSEMVMCMYLVTVEIDFLLLLFFGLPQFCVLFLDSGTN